MTYDDTWDRPHSPKLDDLWQESDCYWFHDAKAGVGGYHRIGQFPTKGTGQSLMFAYKASGFRFRLLQEHSRDSCERTANGQRVGSSTVSAPGGGLMRYGWDELGCKAELEFHDPFYTPRSWMKNEATHKGAAEVKGEMNTDGHLEVSGRIRGTIAFGAETIQLDALAHRDRSWGSRDYRSAYQHRMVTGTLGPELSWATFIMILDNGFVAKAGFVARNGETTDIRDLKVFTEFDFDGLTVAGLRTRLYLQDGSEIEVSGPAVQGMMFVTDGWLTSSHHFIDLAHDGRPGFTILDATNRPSKGVYVPRQSELGQICATDGLSVAGDYDTMRWAKA